MGPHELAMIWAGAQYYGLWPMDFPLQQTPGGETNEKSQPPETMIRARQVPEARELPAKLIFLYPRGPRLTKVSRLLGSVPFLPSPTLIWTQEP